MSLAVLITFLEKSKVLGMGSSGKQEEREKGRNVTLKSEGNMRIKDERIERKRREDANVL